MFFDSWAGLLRVLVVGPLAYAALVLLLRVTGKRTLSKMNAFDLIVTVALSKRWSRRSPACCCTAAGCCQRRCAWSV